MKKFVFAGLFVGLNVALAMAQSTDMTEAEKSMADTINCDDFQKNNDGSWTSGPHAKLNGNDFQNNTIDRGLILRGADVAVVPPAAPDAAVDERHRQHPSLANHFRPRSAAMQGFSLRSAGVEQITAFCALLTVS